MLTKVCVRDYYDANSLFRVMLHYRSENKNVY